jgi:uncharacterized repeat protein (TIGR01451 family)
MSGAAAVTGTASVTINNGGNPGGALGVTITASPSPALVGQTVTFVALPTGGTGSYTYLWSGDCTGTGSTCQKTFGAAGIYTVSVLLSSGGQGVTGTASVTVNNGNNNCTPNYQQRCIGSNIFWYDSCGNQGSLIQYCSNGCSGNTCINGCVGNSCNSCSSGYQQRCLGNNLYWFDSCGNQENFIQYCANGCYGNSCQNNNYNYNNYNNYTNYNSNTILTVSKTVRDLTTGTGFSNSTTANPSDVLMFLITIQNSGNQTANNVFVRDTLPANLFYNNQLIVACTGNDGYNNSCNSNYNYSGSVTSGLNLNTIYGGQTVTISYQTQVASAANFPYGTTTLSNNVSVASSQIGYTPTSNATVIVTRGGAVLGASTVNYPSTGLTNNFWVDSFFLPLLLTLIGLGMWKTGMFVSIEKWLNKQKKTSKEFRADKELANRIANIQKFSK